MWTYGQAEALLAGLYRAGGEVQSRAFRGRLKHLKRLGIPIDSAPGTGTKVVYGFEELCQWSFCLELEEFGMNPTSIVHFVQNCWAKIVFPAYKRVARSPDVEPANRFFIFVPEMMSASWATRDNSPGLTTEASLSVQKKGKAHLIAFKDPVSRLAIIDLSRAVVAFLNDEKTGPIERLR